MANSVVVHFEIYVDDTVRAKKFYETVFGWAFKDWEGGGVSYVLVYPGGEVTDGPAVEGINGGMVQRRSPAPTDDKASANAFVCTVGVENIDEIIAKVEPNGGRIDMPIGDVPGIGKLAYIRDTEMNMLGVIQPLPRQTT